MKLCRRLNAAVSVLASIVVIGCAGGEPASNGEAERSREAEPSSAEDELSASCRYPRRYMAVVTEGECTEVVVPRGRWVPSPLFDDAPEGSGTCFYTWSGEKYARVDREALREHVGLAGALTPSCGAEDVIDDADLVAIPHFTPGSMAGSVGCDVCGILRDGKIWVVLPPEKIHFRELQVNLSNGGMRAFKIEAAEGARLMSLTLPPAPSGTQYVNGRVPLQ